jgi:hypothetical protein
MTAAAVVVLRPPVPTDRLVYRDHVEFYEQYAGEHPR